MDDAERGFWERGVPSATGAEGPPSEDHSDPGTQCWFTGINSLVVGGTTSLVTAPFDLSQMANPVISYWRWFSNQSGQFAKDDVYDAWISGDDGVSWTLVERLEGRRLETFGGWYPFCFTVSDFIVPSTEVRMRFSVHEIEGLRSRRPPSTTSRSTMCTATATATGKADDAEIDGGTAADCNGNRIPDECDIAEGAEHRRQLQRHRR